jgi:hypothetical protein
MKVAIISNGPGAWLFPANAAYDVRIAVNWALNQWPADWLCIADHTAWPRIDAAARANVPHIFTKHDIGHELSDCADCAPHQPHWEAIGRRKAIFEADLKPLPPAAVPEQRPKYSGCYALWLAWHLGATAVDTFGVDLGGTQDWSGQEGATPFCRQEERWGRERRTWFRICEGLDREGVEIRMAGLVPWQHRRQALT